MFKCLPLQGNEGGVRREVSLERKDTCLKYLLLAQYRAMCEMLPIFPLIQTKYAASVVIPILQIRKLRFREHKNQPRSGRTSTPAG